MANRNKTDQKIKYLVERHGKPDFVMEIPASWKVTFGYVNPSTSKQDYSRGSNHCVRIWEGEKLRAVFSDCRGLRDLTIPYAIKITQTESKAEYSKDSLGNFEGNESIKVIEEWTGDDDLVEGEAL